MKNTIFLGATPVNEECASVGTNNYAARAKAECLAYIEAIRKVCGREPQGARLLVKPQAHDFGTYYEVAVVYDDTSAAAEYASKVEEQSPATWGEAGMTAPAN